MTFDHVYTALVTPFNKQGEVDLIAFKKLLKHLYRKGLRGFLIGGTTGESATITLDEKIAMAILAKKLCPDISLLVGVGTNDTARSLADIQMLNHIQEIDAYLCVVPYYNCPSQEGLIAHFTALDAFSDKPIIIYQVPKRCGVALSYESLTTIQATCPHIIGIKFAHEHVQEITQIKKGMPDWLVYAGDDHLLLESLYAGADGVISVISQIIPQAVLSLVQEFHLWQNLEPLDDFIKMIAKYGFIEASPAPVKYLLSKMGLIENYLRLPLLPVSRQNEEILDLLLENETFH